MFKVVQPGVPDLVLEDREAVSDTRWRARLKGRSAGGHVGVGPTVVKAIEDLERIFQSELDAVRIGAEEYRAHREAQIAR